MGPKASTASTPALGTGHSVGSRPIYVHGTQSRALAESVGVNAQRGHMQCGFKPKLEMTTTAQRCRTKTEMTQGNLDYATRRESPAGSEVVFSCSCCLAVAIQGPRRDQLGPRSLCLLLTGFLSWASQSLLSTTSAVFSQGRQVFLY